MKIRYVALLAAGWAVASSAMAVDLEEPPMVISPQAILSSGQPTPAAAPLSDAVTDVGTEDVVGDPPVVALPATEFDPSVAASVASGPAVVEPAQAPTIAEQQVDASTEAMKEAVPRATAEGPVTVTPVTITPAVGMLSQPTETSVPDEIAVTVPQADASQAVLANNPPANDPPANDPPANDLAAQMPINALPQPAPNPVIDAGLTLADDAAIKAAADQPVGSLTPVNRWSQVTVNPVAWGAVTVGEVGRLFGGSGPEGQIPPPMEEATAPTEKIRLSELLSYLKQQNPDVLMLNARETYQAHGVEIAKAGGRPNASLELTGGGQYSPLKDSGKQYGSRTENTLSITQPLFDFGANRHDIAGAEAMLSSAQRDAQDKLAEILLSALDSLLTVQQTRLLTEANRRNLESMERLLNLVRSNQKHGNATLADVKRVEGRLEAAKKNLIDLETQAESATNTLVKLTGLRPEQVIISEMSRLAARAPEVTAQDIENHPSIRSLLAQIESVENQYEAMVRRRMPKVDMEYTYVHRDTGWQVQDDASDAKAQVKVTIPLYDGGINANTRGQLLARRNELHLTASKRRRELIEEARNSTRFDRSDDQKSQVLRERVASLEKVSDLYIEQFGAGRRSAFELLESEADLLSARTELIAQETDRVRIGLRQLRVTGGLVDSVASLP